MNKQKLNIIAIKTDDGRYFLSEKRAIGKAFRSSDLSSFLVNNKKVLPSFEANWVCVESKPGRITKMIKQPNINHRYELQYKSLISEKLPEFIQREDVAVFNADDYEWTWKENMCQYRSLYQEISDPQQDKEEEYDFNMEIVLVVSKIDDPVKIAYKVQRTQFESEGVSEITQVRHQLLDKILFPSIILPQRPCRLSSQDSYKIVRQYIKDNINPKIAKVTSDYNFCFTVVRRIKLAEVMKYTVDVNNSIFSKRKRKPRYIEKQKIEKEVVCFEMTYSPENYKGYTPISGFEARTRRELKEKIDAYCMEVISFINKPLVECAHCNGNGVIMQGKKDTPK